MRVLISGVRGQDGSFMKELHEAKGDTVFGVTSQKSSLELGADYVDLASRSSSKDLLDSFQPDVIYHFAAVHASALDMSSLGASSEKLMKQVHLDAVENILAWQRGKNVKSFFALSSQMYTPDGISTVIAEDSLVKPSTVYGRTKALGWEAIKSYRNEYGVLACGGILFNHSSERSKREFLFPYLASQLIELQNLKSGEIKLRNLYAKLDICDARDVVLGIYLATKAEIPEDFVFASGKLVELTEIINTVGLKLGMPNLVDRVSSAESAASPFNLVGNPAKAAATLGWKAKTSPEALLTRMIQRVKEQSL